mmetsp:Transcript_11890/g.27366  ORF Transcript_11890/g.27366 Transcript_11890/m.27366 type:complete len:465 (+) Transcript_11890:51-1445(+)
MAAAGEKEHVSIVICGHVDSGKSTTTGRLIFELGGISEREMAKLQTKADEAGKSSFAFAFYMDTCAEEQARGITIQCNTKEFHTENYRYSIIDAPGHRDFVKNMITGASQADVGLLLVPADGNFVTALAKGGKDEVQGSSRMHAQILKLIGCRQLMVGVNKMDEKQAAWSQERFNEVSSEMKNVLLRTGWTKKQVDDEIPIIPYSGFAGDNLIKKSTNMPWWSGVDVHNGAEKVHVETILDCLSKFVRIPPRPVDKPGRVPISGLYSIKGVGDVLTGCCEQGTFKNGDEVVFLPTHTKALPCLGKIFTMEAHHNKKEICMPGDNLGFNIKGLKKDNMPKVGDVMVKKSDCAGLARVKSFTAQIQCLQHPGELNVGYSPMGIVRTGRSAMRMTAIHWKVGKETGGTKLENPPNLKANEMAQVEFEPTQPIFLEKFTDCEGLGRLACLESNQPIFLGKITAVVYAD